MILQFSRIILPIIWKDDPSADYDSLRIIDQQFICWSRLRKIFPQPVILSLCRVSGNQSLSGIHPGRVNTFLICRGSGSQSMNSIYPGGVNICEHLELLGETDREERVKSPSHTDGLFRATCLSMSHLQCDIRVWPGPLWTSVSLSNSMRTNPELQRIYAVKARSPCPPKDVCCQGSFPHLCKPIFAPKAKAACLLSFLRA